MGHARKRKLQSSLSKSTELPESLKFVPSVEAPTNGPHTKRQKVVEAIAAVPRDYDTDLLNLQAQQLLKAIRQKHERDDNLSKLIESVRKLIEAIADTSATKLGDARKLSQKSGISLPFQHQPPEDLQLNFEYAAPESITVTGNGTRYLHPDSQVETADLLVEIPSSILQEKDYLNHRVHYKMSYYLFTIARAMKTKYELRYVHRIVFGLHVTVLRIKYKERQVDLQLVLPFDAFDEQKLEPLKNAERFTDGPTPLYNASVLLPMHTGKLYESIETALEKSPHYQDSVLLARQYLSKRSLALSPDQWAVITASLLTGGGKNGGKILSPNASALQLFRGTALFLSQFFDSHDNTITFGDAQSAPGCWIRGFNLFAGLTNQEKLSIGHDLKRSVTLLTDAEKDAVVVFEKVFLDSQDYIGRWDLELVYKHEICSALDIERMWRTLRKALDDRVLLINITRPNTTYSSSIDQPYAPMRLENDELRIGMYLKRPQSQATMVLGPPATSPDAKSFRSFWGKFAELRKFKDGRILEAVVLSELNPTLNASCKILNLHFPNLPELSRVYGADTAKELKLVKAQRVLAAEFAEFTRQARELDDLPLRITSITSGDALFASCAQVIPQHIDGLVQFESSARWPDDLEAIQRTKIAFLLALKEPFRSIGEVQDTRVVLENQMSTVINTNSMPSITNFGVLQVTMSSGLKYLLRIHLDREETLLKNFIKSGVARNDPQVRALYQAALDVYQETYIIGQSHFQHIANQASVHPAYCEAVILLKQWFSAHLLSTYISDRAIELIGLSAFASDLADRCDSPSSAFNRLIRYLAAWDWRLDAIILTDRAEDRKAQTQEFSLLKQQDPNHGPAIYLPYNAPVLVLNRVAALRMTSLAKASFEALQHDATMESILETPLRHFDFVIQLAREKESKYKNIEIEQSRHMETVASFKNVLQDIYGHALWLFTAPYSNVIAVAVDTALKQPRNYKPNLGYVTRPVESDHGLRVVIDVDLIIAEISRLGEGLIRRIDRHKHD